VYMSPKSRLTGASRSAQAAPKFYLDNGEDSAVF